jgi:hypothetical protein
MKALMVFGLVVFPPLSLAVANPRMPELGETVRLAYPAIGCSSFEALKLVSDIAASGGEKLTGQEVRESDCRPFTTIHGEIVQTQDNAVCIVGRGNTRCLWFPAAATEPARRY